MLSVTKMGNREKKKTNIGEVAKTAGVSKMTVSRMLNRPDKVAPKTRVKVQKVIDELHYRPSPMAQSLSSKSTQIIGLMMFNAGFSSYHPIYHPVIMGAEYAAKTNDYGLLLLADPKGEKISRFLSLVDGVLCLGNYTNEWLRRLEAEGITYVLIGRRNWINLNPWFCSIDYSNGYLGAARYLLKMGHRNIAILGGNPDFEADIEKHSGIQRAFFEAGVLYNPSMTIYNTGINEIRRVLTLHRPTAIISLLIGDIMPLLLCVKELGLRIPGDLSIIALQKDIIDTHTLYEFTGIHEFTAVSVPGHELGSGGMNMLLRLIGGEKDVPKEQVMPMVFSEGESCAPPPVKRKKTGSERSR
jgi:DNA-binding LacI/PurR family transcriptional regulator